MHVTIGILAHNEATGIGATLHSLFQQSVFVEGQCQVLSAHYEVLVVPNGCSDNTAEVASAVLRELCSKRPEATCSYRVEEIDRPGKSNAWNELVHTFARPQLRCRRPCKSRLT